MVREGMGTITAPGKSVRKSSGGETRRSRPRKSLLQPECPDRTAVREIRWPKNRCSTEALCFTEAPKKFRYRRGRDWPELGSVWNRLGSEVTMLEFLPALRGFRPRAVEFAPARSHCAGIKFHLETKVTG